MIKPGFVWRLLLELLDYYYYYYYYYYRVCTT